MKVIIPVAGFGSRLRPHTYTIPKALLPVGGKPIIAHIMDQVIGWGGTRFTFIVGHLREDIERFLKANYHFPLEFRQQEAMLGLGHAVLTGLDPNDDNVLIALGDTILDADLHPVIELGVTSIGVKPVEDARKFGVVELKGDRVVKLTEKSPEPPSNLAIVGIYYIRNGALLAKAVKEIIEQGITVKGEYQLTDALQMMLDWGEVITTFPVEGWFDCGKPSALFDTNRFILDRSGGEIGAASIVESQIIPPVHIASDVLIERSVVGPYAVIGGKAVIRHSIVSDSIIGDSAHIEGVVISQSLIGSRCRVNRSHHRINLGASSEIEI